MEKRRIGSLSVSVVGLGCNNFGMRLDGDATTAVVRAALDSGVNYFDTAESYSKGRSEELLGAALAPFRDEVVIATKWGSRQSLAEGEHAGDPAIIRRSVEGSLRRLGTDRIDHYQLHFPDPTTPQAEILAVMTELQREGKVIEVGCSNADAAQLDEAAAVTGPGARWVSVQNHYSVLNRTPDENGVSERCVRDGVALVPFFPLESGLLSGKYTSPTDLPEGSRLAAWGRNASQFLEPAKFEAVARLTAWASARDRTILELAMGWLVSNPVVASVIAGATSPDQVASNVAAAQWRLSEAERGEIVALA